jgi:MFS transporter, PAT family, beta-lactamase induction signal transducer AmpG
LNLLHHKYGRGLLAFAFYFAEGVPIGFIWWAMPTIMRKNSIQLDDIGFFTASLTLPWIFKFLWAPLVDVLRTNRFSYRGWIGISQIMMIISLIPLLFIPLQGNFQWWWLFLFLHSCFAATQDVSVDALVINMVSGREHGLVNGYMQAGMLVGRSLFGGGALIVAASWGLNAVIGLMILAIIATMILLPLFSSPPIPQKNGEPWKTFFRTLKNTFSHAQTWFVVAFALTAAAAFEVAGAFAGPLLIDQNLSAESIGIFFGLPVVLAMLFGGISGGYLSDKMNRAKSLIIFLLGVVASVAALAFITLKNPSASTLLLMTPLIIMYFFTGMFTAASYAFFMGATQPSLGATQFSTYMAATNGCEAWVVWVAGVMAATNGYPYAFLVMCGVSVASLFFLRLASRR